MTNIIGTSSNDTLLGSNTADTIKGLAGNDTITDQKGNDTLTGGGGKDKFIYNLGDGTDTITDFGGVGKGTNPTAAVIAEVDTIKFQGAGLTARNLLLTKNDNNLEITFEGVTGTKLILQNFNLENLDNLKASGTIPDIGNILFNGQTSITSSFNVLDASSTATSLEIKNTVTFLNDLSNNIKGLDNSDDVINGQGGNDKIDGLSGNDLLRGGTGNDTLIGGAGNNTLFGGTGSDYLDVNFSTGNNLLDGGDGNDSLSALGDYDVVSGNNTLNGGAGNDSLSADSSAGNNLLDGGNSNDSLSVSGSYYDPEVSGNNTLNGGAGNDSLSAFYSTGDNFLDGGDDNDYLNVNLANGNNTLNGGLGNDSLSANISTGNNLLDGGDGNDTLSASDFEGYRFDNTSGKNTLNGGGGDDYLNVNYSRGANLLNGGDGNDTLTGSNYGYGYGGRCYTCTGNNTINGGAGADNLIVDYSSGHNLLSGDDGNDILSASGYEYDEQGEFGKGVYRRASGNNTLNGGAGADNLIVDYSTGTNLLLGGDGNDTLSANNALGNNTLDGGFGNDIITGGNGNDTLIGGDGTDTFAFNSYNEGIDSLYDFNATNDLIQVSTTGFGGNLATPSVFASQFSIGTSAITNAQRFIYDNVTGGLFFDQDGSVSAFTQVKFAQLSAGLSLTENNFVVV
ncbi:MAG TPA: calcium-binding protein [Nostoc sp.]|uniref:beta strand repeat-containing protein n=1 Tax=Nostoc sp. TaxID=1180 RepID=UPI002D4B39D0|nr:calcium-binding protein [Nostoc sp.]HYX15157.1 calcium-binding protein [Nostoc sp.]